MNSFTDFINRVKNSYPNEWAILREALIEPGQFTSVLKIQMDSVTEIKIEPIDALRHLIRLIETVIEPSLTNEIKTMLHFELENQHVMLPISILSKLETSDGQTGTARPLEFFQ
jgi:hypothetical protein